MAKRKIIRYVGLIMFLYSIFSCWKFVDSKKLNQKETETIISQQFYNSHAQVNDISYNALSNDYLGYIELEKYHIKRLIINGTDTKNLDKGFVGHLSGSADLDDKYGNTILAGHSIINVFQNLHHTKVGDEIKIVTNLNSYKYIIVEKHVINDNDFSYFQQCNDQKILTLVTCENNNKNRLIVIAKLQE